MAGDTAPARSPGRGGRAGACLHSQRGWVWTAGGRAQRAGRPGGQLVAPPLQTEQGPLAPYWSCLPFPLAKVRPGRRSQRGVSCRCSERGWAGETSGQGQRGHRFTQHTHAHVRACTHTHVHARTHCLAMWEGQRLSHAHTDFSRTLGPQSGWGRGAHQEDGWVPQSGVGFPWESGLSVNPPPAWNSWLKMGDRRPRFSCKAGRGESSSGEAGPMDGQRAGQSHLCSAS